MSADSQWALQQAIHTALTGDATLQGYIGTRVYDAVQDDAAYPYVTIGESDASEWDTKDSDGMEQTVAVHAWSRGRGMKEAKQIMGAVLDALDQQALSVSGHALVLLRFVNSRTLLDPDGLTRHGVQIFRAVTDAN